MATDRAGKDSNIYMLKEVCLMDFIAMKSQVNLMFDDVNLDSEDRVEEGLTVVCKCSTSIKSVTYTVRDEFSVYCHIHYLSMFMR